MSQLIVSTAPHVKTPRTTKHIMLDVLIALAPAAIAGIVFFGWQALVVELLAVASAVLTEFVYYILQNKIWANPKDVLSKFLKQFDFTSVITGLLLALVSPANVEAWYMPVLGGIFAIAVVKMLFGCTGRNIINPALGGRIFLFISFAAMTAYPAASFGAILTGSGSLTTGATQLQSLLGGNTATLSPLDLFLGTGVAGCIGETCKAALLLGGIYLCVRKVIKWYLPVIYIAVTGLFASLLALDINVFLPSILSGGLFLGAIFMATDYVTTPKSTLGNIIYFLLLGLLTAGLRAATKLEVVSFCIVLMNFVVFLIDGFIKCRPFGYKRVKKEKPQKEGK